MKWYGGNIAEAVQRSKQEGAVFFVAIFGEDEPSKNLEEVVTGEEIRTVLSSSHYVCIRLKAESQEHQQFRQIYTNAESPCLYFISLMGSPVEIVKGEKSVADLKEVCESAWAKHAKVLQAQKSDPKPPAAAASQSPPPPVPSSSGGGGEAERNSTEVRHSIEELQDEARNANLTLEKRIERARQLAAAKAELKLKEEAEEARRREKERREAGKGMADLKRWQDEQETKKMVEERKRDKMEEQALRHRLREQIAQDRAERNKRTNASIVYDGAEPGTSGGPKPSVISNTPVNYTGKARLQFRMPDGSSQNHTFEQDVTLGFVQRFLIDGQHVKFRFSLCVAYPRREFTSDENEKSLKDLGLLPSAALLVIPAGGRGLGGPALGGGGVGIWTWITTLLGYLLYPVTLLFGMIQQALPSSSGADSSQPPASRPTNRGESRLGGGGGPSAGSSQRGSGNVDRSGQEGPSPGSSKDLRKRNVDKKTDGNIHRLRNQESDSDEDPGTWNGNSTQQKPR